MHDRREQNRDRQNSIVIHTGRQTEGERWRSRIRWVSIKWINRRDHADDDDRRLVISPLHAFPTSPTHTPIQQAWPQWSTRYGVIKATVLTTPMTVSVLGVCLRKLGCDSGRVVTVTQFWGLYRYIRRSRVVSTLSLFSLPLYLYITHHPHPSTSTLNLALFIIIITSWWRDERECTLSWYDGGCVMTR